MPVGTCRCRAAIPDFVVLGSNLVIQIIQAAGQRYALRANDDAVKVPAVLRINHITCKNIFTDICAVEYRYVRKRRGPCAVTKRDSACRGKKLNLRLLHAPERRAPDDESRPIHK
jgi:hypothetical protein